MNKQLNPVQKFGAAWAAILLALFAVLIALMPSAEAQIGVYPTLVCHHLGGGHYAATTAQSDDATWGGHAGHAGDIYPGHYNGKQHIYDANCYNPDAETTTTTAAPVATTEAPVITEAPSTTVPPTRPQVTSPQTSTAPTLPPSTAATVEAEVKERLPISVFRPEPEVAATETTVEHTEPEPAVIVNMEVIELTHPTNPWFFYGGLSVIFLCVAFALSRLSTLK